MVNALSPYPWQMRQWERLHQQRRQDKLPHALMLLGREGLGLNHFARLLAQSQFCLTPDEDATPCGECPACRQFSQGVYPDYQEVTLLEDKRSILVDQIREVTEFLSLTHSGHSLKSMVLSPAEAMNINAANSLLKTLEEPPGEVLIILVAHSITTLPATIKSRCQFIHFDTPERAVAQQWLAAQSVEQIDEKLLLAGGAPCRALELEATYLDQYRRAVDGFLGVLKGAASITALRPRKEDAEIRALVGWAQSLVRDLLRAVNSSPDARFENRFYIAELRALATSVDSKVLHRVHDHLAQIWGALDHPLNADLVVDDLLLTWLSLKH